jgi:hypothetical protein
MSFRDVFRRFVPVLILPLAVSCTDTSPDPVSSIPEDVPAAAYGLVPAPPPGVVAVNHGGRTLRLWPFTGSDLVGTESDPMNIVFTGEADVVSLRAALIALDGSRTAYGLPPGPPFDCTWTDAFGDIQTTWSDGDGWVGNPVQLQCGNYDPLRIHLRLFPAGAWVLGGAHFELLIPNTTEHEILSWEIAELVVKIDLLRSGLLASPPATAPINPVPSYRATRAPVYNALPPELIALLAAFHGPQPPRPVSADVPIASDGLATILDLTAGAPLVKGSASSRFTITFDEVIPRPFCSTGPTDIVLVEGPVQFSQRVSVTQNGKLSSHGTASGRLTVTPIDPATMQPSGPSFHALVNNNHITGVGPFGSHVNAMVSRIGLPPSANGSLLTHLITAPFGVAHFTRREGC